MKTILFRGKNIHVDRWEVGSLTDTSEWYGNKKRHCFIVDDDYLDREDVEVRPDTVGQYIGINDKNGTKIFEGDVLKLLSTKKNELPRWFNENDLCIVKFDEEVCGFFPFSDYDSDCGENVYSENVEVIGNIYDNPELLEEIK